MDGLNCKFCQRMSPEFTILKCDHVVCAECLWGELKTSLAGNSSIKCPCGQVSHFTSKSILASPMATAHISSNASPRRYSSALRPNRTETNTMSRRKDDAYDILRKKSEIKRSMMMNSDCIRTEKESSLGRDELGRELEFMSIQFKKSMEEVERNFKLVLNTFQKRYENLVSNIRLFWLQEIVQSEPLQVLNISKLFQRKYHKAVGHKLKHLNDNLLQNLANSRLNTLQYQRVEWDSSSLSVKDGKQNKRMENSKMYKEKLFRNIELMKEEGRGLKKMTRKAPKIKFL